jgi:hypothetical protein
MIRINPSLEYFKKMIQHQMKKIRLAHVELKVIEMKQTISS